jgi:hypothetical protein
MSAEAIPPRRSEAAGEGAASNVKPTASAEQIMASFAETSI